MVLQYCNVLVQKCDSNNNNTNINIGSDVQTEFNFEKYLKTFANSFITDGTIEELFAKCESVLYDCDQLLGSDPNNINDTIELIECLRKKHKKVIFTSNRSDKTRQQMLIHLNSLGIKVSINEVFPTSYTTAVYLKAIGFEREVFVIGSEAIEKELHKVGIKCTGLCCHSSPKNMNPGFATFNLNPKVGAVVVSFDRQIPLPHLVKACSYATKPDCLFIVANSDRDCEETEPEAQVAAIRVAANKGFISLGAPHRLYFHCIRQIDPDFHSNRAVIITNRLPIDMGFGKNSDIKNVLIDSNLHNRVKSGGNVPIKHDKPDYLVHSLSSLTHLLSK